MSARVLPPIMLTELYTLRSPAAIRRNLPTNRKINQIKKDLFGPTNSVDRKRAFEDEIGRHQDIATKKWGFDFRNGYPIGKHGQYIWERVSFPDFIPEVYTLSRAAHVRGASRYDEPTELDLLMDERAARANSSPTSSPEKTFMQQVVDCKMTGSFDGRLMASGPSTPGKRQPKITDYMKERKRLAPTPKKLSPVKRLRTSIPLAASLSSFASCSNSTTNRSKMP